MALSSHDAFAAGGGRGRRRRRRGRGALSEINVTPLVDVMLVLLIIFMVSAPLLNVGVPVDLPKTEAGAMQDDEKPVAVTIAKDGVLHLNETETTLAALIPRLHEMPEMSGAGAQGKPIYVRADGGAPYAIVAQVMAKLSTSGFTKLNLVTDVAAPDPAPDSGPDSGTDGQRRRGG